MSKAKTSLFALLLIALVLATAGLLVPTLNVSLLILAGLLFGVFVHAISAWSAKKLSLSYRTTYLVVVALMLVAIGLGIFQLGSQVADRADELWNQLQSAAQTANEQLEQHAWAQKHLPDVSDIEEQLTQSSSDILPAVLQRLQSLGWGMTAALVIFFIGLYAAYDPDLYRDGLVKLMPPGKRARTQKVLDRMNGSLQRWIVARFVSMAIVGIATAIGMWAFGIPMPITLGVLAALLTFIPNIGPLLAAVPQMLLAVNVGTQMVLYVLLFNFVLQTLESYLITPIVQQREVSLPPVLTIAAQLLMGVVVGILGVMLAAPMVVVAMVFVKTLYIDARQQAPEASATHS
ncbi:pheromone autoinducer 2 transporter [Rosistilla carotiformis]|uniref:Pheromone autoinducer 2 transporter n=1 Tax=Rosistilla carotiformis TaxID=2528017 RepID=A0A518K1Y1_9BACT|nr:AI-2E family transporter [Rosistilla carotiformis]QDV71770.1 pheromone autoinducer 2 transporter [Rosistilla carotiformis]